MNKNIKTDEYKKLKRKIVSNIIYILISFSGVFVFIYQGYSTKQDNLLSYKQYERFTCKDKSNMSIEINKDEGWEYIDGYFINNNNSIKASLCEQQRRRDNERD